MRQHTVCWLLAFLLACSALFIVVDYVDDIDELTKRVETYESTVRSLMM